MSESPVLELGAGKFVIGPTTSGLAAGLAFIIIMYALLANQGDSKNLPVFNPAKAWDFMNRRRVGEFMSKSAAMLKESKVKYADQPYILFTELGETVVVPPHLIEEVKSHPSLEFSEGAELVNTPLVTAVAAACSMAPMSTEY